MTKRARGLAALLVLTASGIAYAQATAVTGQIEGSVADESGAALPGTTVTARNLETGFRRSATSDANGLYHLDLLPLGTYEFEAQLQGFAGMTHGQRAAVQPPGKRGPERRRRLRQRPPVREGRRHVPNAQSGDPLTAQLSARFRF